MYVKSMYALTRTMPPELCDMIIDNLCGDKCALSACTLVSPSWKRRARHHLFESVLVARQYHRDAYASFYCFLRNNPDIQPIIRVICVDGYNSHDPDTRKAKLDLRHLRGWLEQVPNLKALLIFNSGWFDEGDMNKYLSDWPRQRIGDLCLDSFRATTGRRQSRFDILCFFSQIDHLYFKHVRIPDKDSTEYEPAHQCIPASASVKVKALTLSLQDQYSVFLLCLGRQPFIKTLESLTLRDLYLENTQDLYLVGEIIRDKMGSAFRTFEIDLPRHDLHSAIDPAQAFTDLLNLDSCKSLESISINMVLDGPVMTDMEEVEDITAKRRGAQLDPKDGGLKFIDTTSPNFARKAQAKCRAEDQRGVGVRFASKPPLYTPEEWSIPPLLLSLLPAQNAITTITLSIELTGPARCVSKHLRDVPDWEKIERECLRFEGLQRVCVRRLEKPRGRRRRGKWDEDVIPVVREWEERDRLEISRRLGMLLEKNVLVFET